MSPRRQCPVCDHMTDDVSCPKDGTATLLLNVPAYDVGRLGPGYRIGGRYDILRPLGRGGFGLVFAARHTGTGQECAVKVLARDLNDDREELRLFFREANATSGLKHPNTIRVFDFGQDDAGFLYLAMELLEGRSVYEELEARRQEGRVFTEEEAIRIGIGVCRSLSEAHVAGLVHRDLKLGNLFLHEVPGDDDSSVKVLDFGVVKTDRRETQVRGTPSFMSPEQIQSQPLDGRSDLYALGVVLYVLVTGRPPFRGKDPIETLKRIIRERPPPIRKRTKTPLSDQFVAVVERLLAKSSDDRPQSAAEVRTLLTACLGETPSRLSLLPEVNEMPSETLPESTMAIAPPTTIIEPRRMNTSVLVLMLMVVLALSAAITVVYLDEPDTPPRARVNTPPPVATPPQPDPKPEPIPTVAIEETEAAEPITKPPRKRKRRRKKRPKKVEPDQPAEKKPSVLEKKI